MRKIGITGKANTGKNTVAKLLAKGLTDDVTGDRPQFIAFADPIKKMVKLSFPEIPNKWLYGSSKYRSEIIPGAFKDGVPLTVRQALMDLGNDFGRRYQSDIWIHNFDARFRKLIKKNILGIVVTDCRFRNEFDYLKDLDFFQIRILRDDHAKIDDESETNQDGILDSEFDAVIRNNGTKEELREQVVKIVAEIAQHYP
jgi:hypothetical protein